MQNYQKAISLKQIKGGLIVSLQIFTLLGSVPYPLPADTFESVISFSRLVRYGHKLVASCGEQYRYPWLLWVS